MCLHVLIYLDEYHTSKVNFNQLKHSGLGSNAENVHILIRWVGRRVSVVTSALGELSRNMGSSVNRGRRHILISAAFTLALRPTHPPLE